MKPTEQNNYREQKTCASCRHGTRESGGQFEAESWHCNLAGDMPGSRWTPEWFTWCNRTSVSAQGVCDQHKEWGES